MRGSRRVEPPGIERHRVALAKNVVDFLSGPPAVARRAAEAERSSMLVVRALLLVVRALKLRFARWRVRALHLP